MAAAEWEEEDGEYLGGCVGAVVALEGSRRVGWSLSACGGRVPVSTAFRRQLWEVFMGVMERSRRGLLRGSGCCGVLHPKALCGLFSSLSGEVRREPFF